MIPRFIATIDGAIEMDRAFNRVERTLDDFRFAWPSVAQEVYAIEEEQFKSEGAHGASGKWPDLSPAYKKWKTIHFPGEPILKRTHSLYESLTRPDAPASIFRSERDQLTIGSKEPYAVVHQRSKRRPRPPFSLTTGDKRRIQKAIQVSLIPIIRKQGFSILDRFAA